MTTYKNFARICGDCWTSIEEETLAFKVAMSTEDIYINTGNRLMGLVSRIAFKVAMIDRDALCTAIIVLMVGAIIGILATMAAYGTDLETFAQAVMHGLQDEACGVYEAIRTFVDKLMVWR